MAYKKGVGENGKLSPDVLRKTITGHQLYKPASISFDRMWDKARKEGVTISLSGKYSAYRPCGEEGDFKQRKCSTGFTQWCAWEKYKAGIGNEAANPTTSKGCKSNHGYGMAIDVSGSEAKKWVRKNGLKYGWWWGEVRSEDWHFTYDPKKDTFLNPNDVPKIDESEEPVTEEEKRGRNINFILFLIAFVGIGYYLYKKK